MTKATKADFAEKIVLVRRARELPAGNVIEDAIDRIFDLPGGRGKNGRRLHRWSRSMDHALVVLTMTDYAANVSIDISGHGSTGQHVHVSIESTKGWLCEGEADTPALAVCRALLDFAIETDEEDA